MSDEDTEIKLVKLRPPEPCNHPDPRMRLTLEDVKRLHPTRQYKTPAPMATGRRR